MKQIDGAYSTSRKMTKHIVYMLFTCLVSASFALFATIDTE